MDSRHTLVVLVEDHPGVLNRVVSLLRRRSFNIDSITVGHSEQPGVSRMTIVVRGKEGEVEQVGKRGVSLPCHGAEGEDVARTGGLAQGLQRLVEQQRRQQNAAPRQRRLLCPLQGLRCPCASLGELSPGAWQRNRASAPTPCCKPRH